jgi:hypothetical protein
MPDGVAHFPPIPFDWFFRMQKDTFAGTISLIVPPVSRNGFVPGTISAERNCTRGGAPATDQEKRMGMDSTAMSPPGGAVEPTAKVMHMANQAPTRRFATLDERVDPLPSRRRNRFLNLNRKREPNDKPG